MKRVFAMLLCALVILTFASCGEKEVSNDDVTPNIGGEQSNSTSDENYSEDDAELLNIQDVIGFWYAYSVYQSPRATDGQYESDDDVIEAALQNPVKISAREFESPLFYTDNAVFKKVPTDINSLRKYGIQIDETLEQLAGEGEIIRIDIYEGDSTSSSFQVFIINGTTMLYEGDGGFFLLAELEESVG